MRTAELELDLDVFAGPFDLLMAVVLREEISLLEVELGEIVVAYLDHLDEEGELDLEAATEFLVLIAALLELKSRLMLPAAEDDELDLGPEEAADELLARMLEYRRYRTPARALSERFEAEAPYLYRSAPLPPELRRASLEAAAPGLRPRPPRRGARRPAATPPPQVDTSHIRPTVSLERAAAGAARSARQQRPARLRQGVRRRGSADPGGDHVRPARAAQAGRGHLVAERELRRDRDHDRRRRRGPVGGIGVTSSLPSSRASSRRCCSSRPSRFPSAS